MILSPLLPVGIQRVSDLASTEEDGAAASRMRPLHVARPSREGRDVGERRLRAHVAASPALPGVGTEPDEPGQAIRVLASGDHGSAPAMVTSGHVTEENCSRCVEDDGCNWHAPPD